MARLIILLFIFCAETALADHLWLKVGEVKTLAAAPSATVRVGRRGIVRVAEGGAGIHVVGLKEGVTTVAIDGHAHVVTVSASNLKEFYVALVARLARMKGLELTPDKFPVEIRGTLLRFSDWLRIADLAREFQGEYIFRARALPGAANEALKHLQTLADNRGLPLLRFSAEPRFTVHVPAGQKALEDSAREIFAPFGIHVRANSGQLDVQPQIRTEVILAEVSRSRGHAFGIEWPSSYEARLLPRASAGESLMATLKALESEGRAQILASPNLLCRSGGEAKFHAGGEFPVRLVARGTRDVVWKRHGVLLHVKPKADFAGSISVEVETEISILDMANGVDGIPALKTNRVKSHFDLPGRRTIALSGLLRQDLGRSAEGLPLLMRLPVLGALFQSRQFMSQESELVIFVTPEVHAPVADTPLEMPKGWVHDSW